MFELPGTRRTRLALAGALFVAVTAGRFAVANPADGVTFLYVIPIALVATELGVPGGIASGVLATLLSAGWALIKHVGVTPIGYGSRAIAMLGFGVVVGFLIEERSRRAAEAARWFSMSNDLLCTASFDGYFTSVNEAWSAVLGYSREELLGRPYAELVHPEDLERTNEVAAGLADPSVLVNFENRYRARDGSWHWLLWSARSDESQIYAVAKDITSRKELESERERLLTQVTKLAQTDELTGLLNHGAWHRHLQHEILRATRTREPLTVVLVDLDEFKHVNDRLGHQAGDRLLKELGGSWLRQVRATDFLGRIGGDEFGLILPDCAFDDASDLLRRLREAVPGETTCSMGLAQWDSQETPERLLLRADEALYSAKRRGRDRIAS